MLFLLPLGFYISSAESATAHAKKVPLTLNATNTLFHCTNSHAWTTNTHIDSRAEDCREAMEKFNGEGEKRRARGGQGGAPYWANPRAFRQPLERPTQWTPVRFPYGK